MDAVESMIRLLTKPLKVPMKRALIRGKSLFVILDLLLSSVYIQISVSLTIYL